MKRTQRGFNLHKFTDDYGAKCSLQKSSSACIDRIWLGIDEPTVKVLASAHPEYPSDGTGWVDVPQPYGALIAGRMHLSRKHVKKLLPMLTRFVETGDIA